MLDLPEDTPALPYPTASSSTAPAAAEPTASSSGTNKRKTRAADAAAVADKSAGVDATADADVDMDSDKRAKTTDAPAANPAAPALDAATSARISSFFGVLDAGAMQAPRQPSRAEMESILLDVRKRALLEKYGV